MAASLARNIVRDHSKKDVEVLYQTIHHMMDAEELHREAMKHKMDGDNHPAWRREILTTSRSHPDVKTKKDETEDINENIKTLESLEVAIRNTLLDRLMVKPDYIRAVAEQYDELFKQTKSYTMVTTNYDNVLETYCEQVGLGIINGFKTSHLGNRRIWDTDAWNDDEYQVEYDPDGSMDGYLIKMRLVKLHGSITWQKDNGTVLEIGSPGLRASTDDVMIPPTLGEKSYDKDIFPELLRGFEAILAKTDLLIVVGFSFRDPKITRMLQDRLRRTDGNRPMRLLYIGPEPEDPEPDGLKVLVDSDDEPREERVYGKCVLWNYSRAELPYVYAYRGKFDRDTTKSLKFVLEAMDEVCGRASDLNPVSR